MTVKRVYFLDCVGNRAHVVAKCPYCEAGVMVTTANTNYTGVLEQMCSECEKPVALYVIMPEHKGWLLAEPVEMKPVSRQPK